MLRQAINSAYIEITPENSIVLIDAINRLQVLPDEKYHLSMDQKYFEILRVLFANKQIQQLQLHKWLFQNFSEEEKAVLYKNLVFLLTSGLNPEDVDDSVKVWLKQFILDNYQLKQNNQNSRDIFAQSKYESEHLYALSTLESKTRENRDRYTTDRIKKEKDALKQAKYIYGIKHLNSNNILKLLSSDEVKVLSKKVPSRD